MVDGNSGKTVRTTISDKAAPCPLDRVNREFRATCPNRLWVSDFTYVSTWHDFVYVAFPVHRGGLIHHSDRGSQYVVIKYPERLNKAGVKPSDRSVGDSVAWPRA